MYFCASFRISVKRPENIKKRNLLHTFKKYKNVEFIEIKEINGEYFTNSTACIYYT